MFGSNVALWAAIVGFLMPLAVAAIIRRGWSARTQAVVGFIASAIATLGTLYFKGNLDFSNQDAIVRTFMVVFVANIAAYHGFWRPTNVAPQLEAKTGGDPAPAAPSAPPF